MAVAAASSRSLREIIRANVMTRFNAVLGALLVVIVVVGPAQDALFGVVLVTNTLIGIIQELRAKLTLDRLAVLSAPRARVIRDGTAREIDVAEVVVGDTLEVATGDQIVCDGVVLDSDLLEVDEALLTGESDPVAKRAGDRLLSGTFVVAGVGWFGATEVGADAYARRLADEARRFSLVHSELRAGVDRILRWITWAMAPIAVLLLASQLGAHSSVRQALAGTVAGVVAMVPEGLVLLTSVAFAVSVVTLGRRRVLVQELPAVEGLARVDVVCIDKTGTLTEGRIGLDHVEVFPGAPPGEADVSQVLGALARADRPNATAAALVETFPDPGWIPVAKVAFSSARKWSGASFEGHGTWVLGAPEVLVPVDGSAFEDRLAELAAQGHRVLLLAATESIELDEPAPPRHGAALVVFGERIRPDAAETVQFFLSQGVELKVLSGDNPTTVAAVAAAVGIPGAEHPVDARRLGDDQDQLSAAVRSASVFGRVQPHQKRAMVAALQRDGHVVAMTGDGVNDVLALKDADIGIAMGSGASATRAVAQLVLLDGRFSTLPGVVAEGRRVIANIERVACLFLTKTVYAGLLALAIGVSAWPFPFLPRHLTLVGSLTIGIPAFFLSLAPNTRRYQPGFVGRVTRFAAPVGIVAAAATFAAYALARQQDASLPEAQTAATVVLIAVGLWVLLILARPLTFWRLLLLRAMAVLGAVTLVLPGVRRFFALDIPSLWVTLGASALAGIAVALMEAGWRISRWHEHRHPGHDHGIAVPP